MKIDFFLIQEIEDLIFQLFEVAMIEPKTTHCLVILKKDGQPPRTNPYFIFLGEEGVHYARLLDSF